MAGGWQPKPSVNGSSTPPTEGSGSVLPQPKKIVVEIVSRENRKEGDL
jgi:hypothetical protein